LDGFEGIGGIGLANQRLSLVPPCFLAIGFMCVHDVHQDNWKTKNDRLKIDMHEY